LQSGSKNFGFIAAFCAYGLFRIIHISKGRIIFTGSTALLYTALILGRFKTAMAIGLVAPILAVIYRSRYATLGLYFSMIVAFCLVVSNATYLAHNLEIIDASARRAVGADSDYSIRTFSDRLRGYENLSDKRNWSFFGLDEDEIASVGSHDMLTGIMVNSGAVGLIAMLLLLGYLIRYIHVRSWRINDPLDKSAYLAFLGIVFLIIASSLVAGSNLHTMPINLTLWTFVGSMIALSSKTVQENKE
jgi:hypothetical protein